MIRRLFAALAALVLASCEPAFATTWTVTNDATLTAACQGAVAGDIVRLADGTYSVPIVQDHDGTSGSRIYFYGNQANPTAVKVNGIYFGYPDDSHNHNGGNYVTVKWIASSTDIGQPEHLRSGYYYMGCDRDSMVKCSTTSGNLFLFGTNGVFDSLTCAGADKHVYAYQAHVSSTTGFPAYNTVKNSTFNYTSSVSYGGTGFQGIALRRCIGFKFFNNTFNLSYDGGNGYAFASELYYSQYNSFQSNTWNYTVKNRGLGTLGVWGMRDSSFCNRYVGNTLTATIGPNTNNTGGLGLSEDGTYSGTDRYNYVGYNRMTFSGNRCEGFVYQSNAFGDTIESNVVSGDMSPLFQPQKNCDSLVLRHNTFLLSGNGTVATLARADAGAAHTSSRAASNVFYATGNNSSGSPTLYASAGWALDSSGVYFAPSGTAANAISRAGSLGAPGSGGLYGASGKSVWGSPRLVDSTFAALDAHLLSGSFADNASGPTHIDGYAGAYAPGAATYWTITASAGSNGSISPSGSVSVVQGASQTFTITPDTNFAVDSLKVDGAYVGALTTYTFTNVQAAHTIAATFKASVTNYTITASASGGVSISPNGPVTVASGGSQAFTITPTTGYHIVGISVDGSSVGTSSPYTFTNVTANHTIVATGGINTYTITASSGLGGAISPSGSVPINYGGAQTFTISPSVGYHVNDVLVDGSSVGSVTSYPFTNVTANHTISASFLADVVGSYTITASATGFGSVTPSGATAWAAGTSPVYTIVPLDGYQTDDVLVDGVSVGTPTVYTFTNLAASHTISATFSVALVSYTITASAANGATITPSGQAVAASGASKSYAFTVPANSSAAVYVDGVYAGQLTSYTFSSISDNHTIFVTAVSNGANGTASSPVAPCGCRQVQ